MEDHLVSKDVADGFRAVTTQVLRSRLATAETLGLCDFLLVPRLMNPQAPAARVQLRAGRGRSALRQNGVKLRSPWFLISLDWDNPAMAMG